MARLLVLFGGADESVLDIAHAVHEGARSVRFAESDLMRLPGDATSSRITRILQIAGPDAFAPYDAVVLGAPQGGAAGLEQLLSDAKPIGMKGLLANKLGSVFPAQDPKATGGANPLWPLLAPMSRYGMILVPPGYAGPAGEEESLQDAARRLGRRLVDIAGWITHARSHAH